MPDINKRSVVISICMLSSLATLIFIMQPYISGMAAEKYGLSDTDIGTMAAFYYAGFSLITLSAPIWIRRVNWKSFGFIASIIAFSSLAISAWTNTYNSLLIALFGAGCGSAIIFSISNCLVGDMNNPDQKFGIRTGTEQLVGAVALIVIPSMVVPIYGFSGLLISLAVLFLVISPAAFLLPRTSDSALSELVDFKANKSSMQVIIGLILLGLFHTGLAGIWTFLERIGNENGMEADTITNLLALAALSGFTGPYIAAMIAQKAGWKAPILWGSAAIMIVVGTISFSTSPLGLGIAFALLPGAWFFVISFYMGIIADADYDGKFVVLIAAALAIASAVGPLLTGFIRENYGMAPLLVVTIITTLVSAYGFLRLAQLSRKV